MVQSHCPVNYRNREGRGSAGFPKESSEHVHLLDFLGHQKYFVAYCHFQSIDKLILYIFKVLFFDISKLMAQNNQYIQKPFSPLKITSQKIAKLYSCHSLK